MDAGVDPGWHVQGDSLNGERTYEVQIDPGVVSDKEEARRFLGALVVNHVYHEHGSTPAGMPWLLNPMTVSINGEPSLAERLKQEG